jgi:putative photosynthetic complex assembly protein 2
MVAAFCYALVLWWAGTVAILLLVRFPRRTDRLLRGFSVAGYFGGLGTLALLQQSSTLISVYASFTTALIIWGAVELAYFKGWLTGPSNAPCPARAGHWQRFKAGVQTSLHHELIVIGTAAVLGIVALWSEQTIGTLTFIALWLMRWSAKLNLFFGVRNFNCEMLPEAMHYLQTYVRRAPMNAFFPASIIIAGAVLLQLIWNASLPGVAPAAQAGGAMLATLLLLGIIEHLLLVLPISDRPIWRLGLGKQAD